MKTEAPEYALERAKLAQQPVYIAQPYHVVRAGQPAEWPFSRGFASGPIQAATRDYLDLLGRPTGNTQTVVPEEGQSSVGTFALPLQDQDGEVLRYLSNPRVVLANSLSGSGGDAFIEGRTSIGGYPAIGTLQIGAERIRYGRRHDATNRFMDLERAVDGTAPQGHISGAVMQNGEQLRAGQRIQLLAGYRTLDERAFLRFAKMEITSVGLSNDGLTYVVACADIQRFLRQLVFPATQDAQIDIEGHPITIALRMLLSTGTAAVSTGSVQMIAPNILLGTDTDFLSFFRPGEIVAVAPFTADERILTVASVESPTRLYVTGDVSAILGALGKSLITNGTFQSSLNGWTTAAANGTVTWESSSKRAKLALSDVGFASLRQTVAVEAGKAYEVAFTLAGSPLYLVLGSSADGSELLTQSFSGGVHRVTVTSPTPTISVKFHLGGSSGLSYIDDVSLRRPDVVESGPIPSDSAAGLTYRRAGRAGVHDLFNGSWSVAMPAGFIDVPGLEALRDERFPTTRMRFLLNGPEDGKDFLEREIWKPLNAYPFITQDGAYSARVYEGRAGTAGATLDEDQIIGWTWQGGEERIINQVEVQYDWNEGIAPNTFGLRQRYTGSASVEKYGRRPPFKLASKGWHTAHAIQGDLDRWAFELLQRFSDAAPRLQLIVRYGQHVVDVGDTVAVTHPRIPNRATGARGLMAEPFQVRDVRPMFGAEGKVVMTLLQVSVLDAIDQPVGDPAELARTDLIIQRASYFNAATEPLTANTEEVVASVTVTMQSIADTLAIEGRHFAASGSTGSAGTLSYISRLRLGGLAGQILDSTEAEGFMSAPADKAGGPYFAKRDNIAHLRLFSPNIVGSVTIVMTAQCNLNSGTSRNRSLVTTVRRP